MMVHQSLRFGLMILAFGQYARLQALPLDISELLQLCRTLLLLLKLLPKKQDFIDMLAAFGLERLDFALELLFYL